MKLLLFFLFTVPVYAAITPAIVKDRAEKFHPTVQAALERMRAGEASVVGARGAFDARVVSDYKRQTRHDLNHNTTLSRTQLEKGLRVANSKIYAGAEQISNPTGFLAPIYNTGNPGSQYGNYSILGARVSLWKNFMIDPDRANLQNRKYDAKIAQAEKTLTVLDIRRLSQFAYWEWVTATKVKNAFEELVKNGEMRNEFLVTRKRSGDIAQILVTENEQYVASRKGSLQAARERLIRAEYALALFHRDDNGEPLIPKSTEEFEDYPKDLSVFLKDVDLNTNMDELMKRRPDLRSLALQVDRSNVDLELARQDLKPQVDVTTEYFKRTLPHPNTAIPSQYFMVMAQLNIPIERNLGNGNIAAARARRMVVEKELSYGLQNYKFEVLALGQSLNFKLEQVVQSEIEFTKAKELVTSEAYKFKSGGGNLFLINIREQALASAEVEFHEARLAFMDRLLTYQALVSTGE